MSDGRSAYTASTAETEPLASELYIPQFFSDCQPTFTVLAWGAKGAAWHQEQVPTSSDTSSFFF